MQSIVMFVLIDIPCPALNNFVKLTPIEPHSTALWTEVDLDALAVADHQVGLALRALHVRGLS